MVGTMRLLVVARESIDSEDACDPIVERADAGSVGCGGASNPRRAVGVEGARPYDLRHSFCSLLLYEGRTIVEVARQAGHAPSMSLDTYQHVIDDLEAVERVPAEEQIRRARASLVPVSYPLRA